MQILAAFLSAFSCVTTSEINDFWTYQCFKLVGALLCQRQEFQFTTNGETIRHLFVMLMK